MMRLSTRVAGFCSIGALLALGCATGVNETGDFGNLGGGGAGGVITGVGGMTDPTTSNMGGMGGDLPMGGMGGMGDGGGMNCDFASPNTCMTAETVPSVAGDENDPVQTRFGVTSKWLQVQITEENSSVLSDDLSYTVTLTSAPGTDYDLIVHQGAEDGPPNCTVAPRPTTDLGNGVEEVSAGWDDDQGIGGEDDSLWLSIEVRYVSGTACDASAQWTLEIEGDT